MPVWIDSGTAFVGTSSIMSTFATPTNAVIYPPTGALWTNQTATSWANQTATSSTTGLWYMQLPTATTGATNGITWYRLPDNAIYRPAAPAIITHQEQAARDRELYRRAIAEHDGQEAARILRLIEAREHNEAERLRLVEQQAQAQQERYRERQVATARALELLHEHLTPQQRQTFKELGWFIVEGGKTKTKYRIRSGTLIGNVDVMHGHAGMVSHRLCGHVRTDKVPHGDQLLAQKIMLELAEDDFLRIANRHAA